MGLNFIEGCRFCEEGADFAIARRRLGDNWPFADEVVFHDRNVFAIVGSSPQVIPYLLILPYRHVYSVSEMSQDEQGSMVECLDYLLGRGGYGDELCIFEHGGRSESGSSSIDHCHVHVIDGHHGLFNQHRFDDFQLFEGVLPEISESYLMVGRYSAGELVLKVSTSNAEHERQYFRRRLGEIIGDAQWDWRDDAKIDKMAEIMRGFVKQ